VIEALTYRDIAKHGFEGGFNPSTNYRSAPHPNKVNKCPKN